MSVDVIICAGHHEGSEGASNEKYGNTEYRVGLRLLPFIMAQLAMKGITYDTVDGTLRHKIDTINADPPRLAIDLHHNADLDHSDPHDCDDSRGRGCMVVYCPQSSVYGDKDSEDYSRRRQAALFSNVISGKIFSRNLGARQGWYWGSKSLDSRGLPTKTDAFVTQTKCPAFIPEPGYIDNNKYNEEWLEDERGFYALADAISAGIVAVLEEL